MKHLVEREFKLVKVDLEQRLVFGIFSVSTVGDELLVDSQDDVIPTETLEKAAYDFVLNARMAGRQHVEMQVGRLVESVVLTKEKQEAINAALKAENIEGSINIEAEIWWGGFFIEDDAVWKGIKKGDFPGFSIGGEADREPLKVDDR